MQSESAMDGRVKSITPATTTSEGEIVRNTARTGKLGLPDRQRETAQYISDMILELRNLAKAAKLYPVMVPLEYAYYEAFGAANRVEVPQEDLERLKEISRVSETLEPPVPGDY
jgi:hypothetical protein